MIAPFTNPLPRSAYFRLLEHQKKTKLNSYQPDLPLVLFISFSRVAAGLSLVSVFFPESMLWSGVSVGCMILATLASIAHLSAPQRFLTMIINSRSYLVWEIRLAGALTTFLGFQFLASLGWFQSYGPYLPWINFVLSILFLLSTGWAYRFDTHPAWRTSILPLLLSRFGPGRWPWTPVDPVSFCIGSLLLCRSSSCKRTPPGPVPKSSQNDLTHLPEKNSRR